MELTFKRHAQPAIRGAWLVHGAGCSSSMQGRLQTCALFRLLKVKTLNSEDKSADQSKLIVFTKTRRCTDNGWRWNSDFACWLTPRGAVLWVYPQIQRNAQKLLEEGAHSKKKSTHLIQILFQVWFRHYDKLNQNHSSGFCRLTAPERPPNVFGLERCDHCMELKPSYIHRTKCSIKIRELTRTSVKVQRTERELATNQGLSEFSEISQRQLTRHNNHAHHNKVNLL